MNLFQLFRIKSQLLFWTGCKTSPRHLLGEELLPVTVVANTRGGGYLQWGEHLGLPSCNMLCEICCKPARYTAGILSLKNCNVFTGLDDGFKVSEHKQVTMSWAVVWTYRTSVHTQWAIVHTLTACLCICPEAQVSCSGPRAH